MVIEIYEFIIGNDPQEILKPGQLEKIVYDKHIELILEYNPKAKIGKETWKEHNETNMESDYTTLPINQMLLEINRFLSHLQAESGELSEEYRAKAAYEKHLEQSVKRTPIVMRKRVGIQVVEAVILSPPPPDQQELELVEKAYEIIKTDLDGETSKFADNIISVKNFSKKISIIQELRKMDLTYLSITEVDEQLIKLFNDEINTKQLFQYINDRKPKIETEPVNNSIDITIKIDKDKIKHEKEKRIIDDYDLTNKNTLERYANSKRFPRVLTRIEQVEKLFSKKGIGINHAWKLVDSYPGHILSSGKDWDNYISAVDLHLKKHPINENSKRNRDVLPEKNIGLYRSVTALRKYKK